MGGPVDLRKGPVAAIRVRLLPWRPRPRTMDPKAIREAVDQAEHGADVVDFVSDTVGLVLVAGMLVAAIGAPILVILLAALLLPFEIALVLVLAAALLLARLAGAIPWVVEIAGPDGPQVERYRNLIRAVRRVRALNGAKGVPVRFSLSG